MTAGISETVGAPRVMECPVQMEVVVEESILMEGHPNRVDPDKWRPLIMSFQEFYGLGEKVHSSRLGTIPESEYRTADIERAGCQLAS